MFLPWTRLPFEVNNTKSTKTHRSDRPKFIHQQWWQFDFVDPNVREVFLLCREQDGKGTHLWKEKETLGETDRIVGMLLLEKIGERVDQQLLALLHLLRALQVAAI